MKLRLLATCALILVAGCSGGGKTSSETAAPVVRTSAVESSGVYKSKVSAEALVYSRLPVRGIRFGFPFTFKYDKASLHHGKVRAAMKLAYRDSDSGQVWNGLDRSFQQAGYGMKPYKADSKNHERRKYMKRGSPSVIVTVVASDKKPTGGSVRLKWSWKVKHASKAKTGSGTHAVVVPPLTVKPAGATTAPSEQPVGAAQPNR